MSKRRQRYVLTVRVEFEPNRRSQDCLQQAYQLCSPTVAVSLAKALNADELESDQQTDSDALQTSRSPQ
jgi:hypothetical protein